MRETGGAAILRGRWFAHRRTTLGDRASGCAALRRSRSTPVIAPAVALAALVAVGLAIPGVGVAQTSIHVRGVVVESDKRSTGFPPMVVRQDDGALVTVEMAINAEAIRVAAAALPAIVPPRHAAAIVERTADGTLHARVVMLYPDNVADGREGDIPWDRPAGSRRIQGIIAAAAPSGAAVAIALRYGDTQSTIVADAATQVVEISGLYDKLYTTGDAVFIAATRQRDGRITAGRVFFAKDGFAPPM
jgi:hypothetical protein